MRKIDWCALAVAALAAGVWLAPSTDIGGDDASSDEPRLQMVTEKRAPRSPLGSNNTFIGTGTATSGPNVITGTYNTCVGQGCKELYDPRQLSPGSITGTVCLGNACTITATERLKN